jgi:hypothetical protein
MKERAGEMRQDETEGKELERMTEEQGLGIDRSKM